MVLFFLIARRHPQINEYRFRGWEAALREIARGNRCQEWHSTPMRFVRIILNATQDEQAARWDMTKIEAELALLHDVVSGRREVITAELLAEELLFRSASSTGPYEWQPDRLSGRIKAREGFELRLKWDERERRVITLLEWLQTGNYKFESLKRYIGEATGAAEKALRAGQWEGVSHRLTVGTVTFQAFVPIEIAQAEESIRAATGGLVSAFQELSVLSVKSQ
jgi:hypothetical protein